MPTDSTGSGRSPDASSADDTASVTREIRIASAIVALQGLALVAAAVLLVVKSLLDNADSIGRALFAAALALVAAAVLGLCAQGLRRGLSSSRSPIVVLEVVAIPVGFSLGFQAGLIGYGGPIVLTALAVLVLMFSPGGRRDWA